MAEPMEIDKGKGLAGDGPSTSGKNFDLPWVEKYRPQLVRDIVGNVEAVGRLQVIAEEGNLPNIILAAS